MCIYVRLKAIAHLYKGDMDTRVGADKWQMPNLINDFSIRELIMKLLLAIYFIAHHHTHISVLLAVAHIHTHTHMNANFL